MVSAHHTAIIMETLNSLPVFPMLILCGDSHQLQPFANSDGHIQCVDSLFNCISHMPNCQRFVLTDQTRCTDNKLNNFLKSIRSTQPSNHTIRDNLEKRSLLSTDDVVDAETIEDVLSLALNTYFLCYSNAAVDFENSAIVQKLFSDRTPDCHAVFDKENQTRTSLYPGMMLSITRNFSKQLGYVNGQRGTFLYMHSSIIYMQTKDSIVPVHPITNAKHVTFFPLRISYATTIAKSQGQTLPHITLWFDTHSLPTGCAYVALSRVRSFDDILFLQLPTSAYFKPRS